MRVECVNYRDTFVSTRVRKIVNLQQSFSRAKMRSSQVDSSFPLKLFYIPP